MGYFRHESAFVDAGAQVGEGTKVWHFCHVSAGARVGSGCVLGQNVFVADGAVVGDGVRVQNNVSIYRGVVLEDQVFVGPGAVFTNVRNPRAEVSRKDQFLETRVGHGATLGANATVVCGHRVGAYAFVAAGAVVTSDVRPHALVMGVPARQTAWMCRCGERLASELPEGETAACDSCASVFRLVGGALEAVAAPR